jgi:uncharacterized membrane protein YfcA
MELSLLQNVFIFASMLIGETFGCIFGGGGFFIQPALLSAGVSAKLAVANDVAAAAFGCFGFLLTSKQRSPQIKSTAVLITPSLIIGAVVGGNILEVIPESLVRTMVLLICGSGFFYTLARFRRRKDIAVMVDTEPVVHWKVMLVLSGVLLGFYDGISGAGGGIITIATLSLIMRSEIKVIISMANWVSAVSLSTAGLTFLHLGLLDFNLLAIMIPAAFLAGFLAGRLSDALPEKALRATYACVLGSLLAYLLYDAAAGVLFIA